METADFKFDPHPMYISIYDKNPPSYYFNYFFRQEL